MVEPHHPLVRGIGDFTLTDEVYGDLALHHDVVPLMQAPPSAATAERIPCFGNGV